MAATGVTSNPNVARPYYVYILKRDDGESGDVFTGYTNNLQRVMNDVLGMGPEGRHIAARLGGASWDLYAAIGPFPSRIDAHRFKQSAKTFHVVRGGGVEAKLRTLQRLSGERPWSSLGLVIHMLNHFSVTIQDNESQPSDAGRDRN